MAKQERGAYGKNMIKLALRFWTNDLPKGTDEKTAWNKGVIYLYANKNKGLKPDMERFDSIEEITAKLLILLKRNDIKLIETPKFTIVNK